MKKRRKRVPGRLLGVLLLVAVVLGAWGLGKGRWLGAGDEAALAGRPVVRGPLTISVHQRGNLEARNAVELKSEIEGRSTVIYLVPEGTMVQPGDLVAELDASTQKDQRVVQEIAVQNARAALTKAQQDLEIQRSQNASDIAAAEQKLEFAAADLRKYEEGDWPQQLQEAEEAIVLAREELAQAKDRLDWSTRLEADGFLTRTELERDQLAYERAKIALEQAERRKKLLVEYDHPKELQRLKALVEEAQRELERVKLQANARLVDKESALRAAQARLDLETEKLAKLERQIQAAKLVAPVAGMVVHARTEGRFGSGEPIQEGSEIRERQVVATIPREGGMIVEAKIHESVLKKVRAGQECIIRVDALPGREFRGHVESVAVLPDKGAWWMNPDQRLYKTAITIDNPTPDMRPGMSCDVEILVDRIPDTLYVPLQAVFLHNGRTICFVNQDGGDPEVREVKTGESTDEWVQILDGLQEGEVVLLAPPPGFDLGGNGQGKEEEEGPAMARPPGGGPGTRPAGRAAGRVPGQAAGRPSGKPGGRPGMRPAPDRAGAGQE